MFNSNSMYVMNCLYVKMLGLLFLVVFCCGKVQSQVKVMSMPAANGQTLSALTEEVIQGWRPFSINGAESFDAILKQKAEIEKNILSKNTKDKSAVLANTVWAIREVFLYYRENQSAEVNKKEIQKLLNKVSLLDFCNLHSLFDCFSVIFVNTGCNTCRHRSPLCTKFFVTDYIYRYLECIRKNLYPYIRICRTTGESYALWNVTVSEQFLHMSHV